MEQLKRGISTLQHLVPTLSRFVLNPGKRLPVSLVRQIRSLHGIKKSYLCIPWSDLWWAAELGGCGRLFKEGRRLLAALHPPPQPLFPLGMS